MLLKDKTQVIDRKYSLPEDQFLRVQYTPKANTCKMIMADNPDFDNPALVWEIEITDLVDFVKAIQKAKGTVIGGTGIRRRRTEDERKYNIPVEKLEEFRSLGIPAKDYAKLQMGTTKAKQ